MTVKVLIARASAQGNVPSSFVVGQIGIDEFSGKLFWHLNGGGVAALPLLAPTNTILGNNTASTAAPTYLTATQTLALIGAAPAASPTLTGTVSITGTLIHTGIFIDRSYIIATPTTATTVTIAATTGVQILAPAGTLAVLTVAFPASPADGTRFEVATTQTITSLTCTATGTTIKNAPTTLAAGAGFEYIFTSTASTWYRLR